MLYFAYGSNLSKRAMRERAPLSVALSAAVLPEHALLFETNEPAGAAEAFFANIRPQRATSVPGALYEVEATDLAALDAYEDVSRGVYERVTLGVAGADGRHVPAIVYRMRIAAAARLGMPSRRQLDQIRTGYSDWGLDVRVLEAALESIKPRIA